MQPTTVPVYKNPNYPFTDTDWEDEDWDYKEEFPPEMFNEKEYYYVN
jgi:hypothetical protein